MFVNMEVYLKLCHLIRWFRMDHSTETANCFDADLNKAFGTANHNVLVPKLSTHTFLPGTVKGIASDLSNRNHCTRINGKLSTDKICSVY